MFFDRESHTHLPLHLKQLMNFAEIGSLLLLLYLRLFAVKMLYYTIIASYYQTRWGARSRNWRVRVLYNRTILSLSLRLKVMNVMKA